MADVTLVIKADTANAVKGINDVQKATQKLHDTATQGERREKGILEEIEATLQKLQKARQKAFSYEDIAKYNKKIAETKLNLQEYEQAGLKVEKQGNSMWQAAGKWAMGFATVGAALATAKKIIASTEEATHAFEIVIGEVTSGVGFFFKAIASGDWSNFGKGLGDAIRGARQFANEMEDIENRKNEQVVLSAEASAKIAELRMGTFDKGIENVDKLIENTKKIIEIQKVDFEKQAIIAKDTYETTLKKSATDNAIAKDRLENLVREYTQNKKNIELGEKYNEVQNRLKNAQKSQTGFVKVPDILNEVEALNKEAAAIGINAEEVGKIAMAWGKVPKETRNLLAELKAQQISLEGQAKIGSRRDENLLAAALNRKEAEQKSSTEKIIEEKKKAAEKELKLEEDKQKAAQKLIDDYDKSQIESLTGVAKLEAQRDFGIKQIKEIRDNLAKLGPITEEQYNMLQQLADNVWTVFYDELKKQAKIQAPETVMIDVEIKTKSNLLKDVKKQLLEAEAALLKDSTKESVLGPKIKDFKLQIAEIEKSITTLTEKKVEVNVKYKADISEALLGKDELDKLRPPPIMPDKSTKPKESIWELFGIDPGTEEGAGMVKAITEAKDTTLQIMDEVYQARVDDAQRNRELLDTQISEKQQEIETETQLYKAGYASNVDEKKRELALLQSEREKALKKEEKALKAQRTLDTIQQTSSLITASADIFKSMAKLGPIGVAAAVISVGAMLAAFAATKIKAAQASGFAKGGWTGDGGEKDSTGERVAGVIHEKEFAVRKGPASKFRDVLEAINRDDKKLAFSRFVKLDPQLMKGVTVNNVTVENEGPNKRLDQLIQLNKRRNKEEVIHLDNHTIYKKGNITRMVRN